jgi:hypothetical protein
MVKHSTQINYFVLKPMHAAAQLTNFPRFIPETNSCGVYTYPPTPSVSEKWRTRLSTVSVMRLCKERRMALCN